MHKWHWTQVHPRWRSVAKIWMLQSAHSDSDSKGNKAIVDYSSPALCTLITPFPSIGDAACHQHAGGRLIHRHRHHAQKFCKDRACGSGGILTDTQRQTYSSQYFASAPTGKVVMKSVCCRVSFVWRTLASVNPCVPVQCRQRFKRARCRACRPASVQGACRLRLREVRRGRRSLATSEVWNHRWTAERKSCSGTWPVFYFSIFYRNTAYSAYSLNFMNIQASPFELFC